MSTTIYWGFNPGMHSCKNAISIDGKFVQATAFLSVIAPAGRMDDLGLGGSKPRVLTATVGGRQYQGGALVARLETAQRAMGEDMRLDPESPMYQALAQMSLQHLGLAKNNDDGLPEVSICTALPVGWKSDQAEQVLEGHIRAALKGLVKIKSLYVRSEPAAVVYDALLGEDGRPIREQIPLKDGLVCVADIGGGTLNRSILEGLVALPDQSQSPMLGSKQAIEQMRVRGGLNFVDAERRLRTALESPGQDDVADSILRLYRDSVLEELKTAWRPHRNAAIAYFVAGGTAAWVKDGLQKEFGKRLHLGTQQTIANGLCKYAVMKAGRK